MIADEPTAALDARNARRIADHLFAAVDTRLLLVTHDLGLARRCESAVHVAGGTIVDAGAPEEVIAAYEDTLRC